MSNVRPHQMQSFEGYLDRVQRSGSIVKARLVAGGYDPSPTDAPVVAISVEGPAEIEALYEALLQAREVDNGCYLAVHSSTEATLTTDHGEEIALQGKAILISEEQYDAKDFESLAKQNHDWGMSQYQALSKQSERLQKTQDLLREQLSRISIKIQGHPPGTTAYTLYEQHLAFLARALSAGEA